MFDLVSDVGSSDVVVKAFRIILNHNLTLALAFVLPLDKLLFQIIVGEWLYKRTELFLLVVSGRSPGVHEDGRTEDCGQYLWFLKLTLVDVENDEQVEVNAFVIVSCGAEFDGTEVNLTIDHLHLALPPDSHINESHPVSFLVLCVLFDSENLSLKLIKKNV